MPFTEFYCQNGGSNLNSGSTDQNSAFYTSSNGGWNQSTGVFTPTDGTNPVAQGVAVGQFANVHLDGATLGTFVGRITAVVNAVNGTITVSISIAAGSAPTGGASGRRIKVGGAWKGPNGSEGFPFNMLNLGKLVNTSGDQTRVRFLNDADYSITAHMTQLAPAQPVVYEGYGTDRAVITGGASAIQLLTVSNQWSVWKNFKFRSAATSGSNDLVVDNGTHLWFNCVFDGARGCGVRSNGASIFLECEAFDCNKSNISGNAGFLSSGSGGVKWVRCVSHDHLASNGRAFHIGPSNILVECIAANCGEHGVRLQWNSSCVVIKNCDFYNLGGTGIFFTFNASDVSTTHIESCNFIKTNRAININGTFATGFIVNCGYGSGTMANTNPSLIGSLLEFNAFTYPEGNVPWEDPDEGNFNINHIDAIGTGRGEFATLNFPTFNLTKGYPDVGAAQKNPVGVGQAGGGGPDDELTRLINRARKSIKTINNISIVGPGFSGASDGGFMYNPD
jgi:hypothetical protein